MSLQDKIDASTLVTSAVSACAAGFLWLVRRVLTNQRQIELLQSEIKHRDYLRREDREAVKEVRDDVKALRRDIQDMFARDK